MFLFLLCDSVAGLVWVSVGREGLTWTAGAGGGGGVCECVCVCVCVSVCVCVFVMEKGRCILTTRLTLLGA